MDILALAIVIAFSGLLVGGLARFAVPGPDPMSIWQTIALGIAGSIVGGVAAGFAGFEEGGGLLFALLGAVLLLLLYRRIRHGRALTGPTARGLSERADPIDRLRELRKLRDRGQISREEFERRRDELTARL